ncbi:META domain-containing protein [Geitlerinema sp. P-1104]|uniref:META domain-containing protein n=1 Tax=Geitlerinema sp. P-1104 TaxID=2546230 RepID=UPI001476BF60|nr:META domain-containing protein [Geitlerinema sp. P-1104]NMG59997.1 META domain-containing protein [Geitlerinema sp. P-1104]
MSFPLMSLATLLTVGAIALLPSASTASIIQVSLTNVSLPASEEIASLADRHWQLTRWNHGPLNPELPAIDLQIEGDRLTGSAGCNRYVGPIEQQQGQRLQLGALASTRLACERSLMERENRYLQALGAVQKYGFTADGNLWLAYHSESGTGTLEFSQVHDSR